MTDPEVESLFRLLFTEEECAARLKRREERMKRYQAARVMDATEHTDQGGDPLRGDQGQD